MHRTDQDPHLYFVADHELSATPAGTVHAIVRAVERKLGFKPGVLSSIRYVIKALVLHGNGYPFRNSVHAGRSPARAARTKAASSCASLASTGPSRTLFHPNAGSRILLSRREIRPSSHP